MRLSGLSSRLLAVVAAAATLPTCLGAAQTLYTNSVSSCSPMAGTGAVNLTQLNLVYHRSNQSIVFSFALNTQETGLTLSANLYGEAYGNQIVNDTIDLCSLIGGVLCPLPQLDLAGVGTYTLPSQYTSQIPGLAWTVPNLDAFARLEAMFPNGSQAACVQMTFSNGLTTEHLGVKLASGLFTLVALLVGFAHSIALVSPSPAQYRWLDVLLLFQTAAATGLLRLDYPLNYLAFTHNFWWALGLFSNGNVEASINKMRYRTGGYLSGSAYPGVEYINRKMTGEYTNINELIDQLTAIARFLPGASSIFGRRSMSHATAAPLARREVIASPVLTALSSSVDVGIPQYVNTEGIPTANAFDTIFFWFLAFIAIVIAVHVILGIVVWACSKSDQEWAVRLKRSFGSFFMGNMLLTCVFWFLPIWIFAFYQFKIGDSRLSIAFAALAIAATALPLLIAFSLSLFCSRRSQRTAPITYSYAKEDTTSRLYTSPRWYHSVGALYRPYRQKFHWFWFILVLALLIRSAFIAFPSDPWRQVIGNVVLEFIVLILLIAFRPHKDKKGDWLAPFLSFCRLAAFGLLIAFIPSVGTAGIPKAIIGFVIIALFGVPTVLLFLGLIFNAFYGILWRRRTLKVEDGLEVRRYPSDDDASRTPMQQQRFGPNNRASLAPPAAGQRRSVFEPNATGNAYEPSAASNRYSAASGGYASNRHSSQYGYNPDQLTPPAGSRPSSRASRGTGATQYYTPQEAAVGEHNTQEYFRDGRY